MKFSINRSVFVKNLVDVQRAISTKTTIPVLTGVKILTTDEGVLLTGSDSTISIEAFISAENEDNQLVIEQTGSVVLPARFFGEIVKKLPSDIINIEMTHNLQTEITADNTSFTLNGIDANEYPKLPEIDTATSFIIPSATFKQIIQQTIVSVSSQEIRPIFTGIHFEIANNHLKAVATDSHRLSQRIVPLTVPENLAAEEIKLNIPGRSLNELTRIIDDNTDIQMMITDNQVLFKTQNIYIYSRLLEGQYPDTDRLLPKEHQTLIEIPANQLLSAVERALILSHEGKNNVVKLSITPEKIILSGHSAEIGDVEEELMISQAEGNSLDISFNPDYLKEALRTFGPQDIQIKFQSASHPFIILPVERKDTFDMVQLITPIRTPGN